MDELPGVQMLVSVDEPYDGEIDAAWLEGVARTGLAASGVVGDAEVSLLITGDETVRALNAEYRGLDETTDVLSFSAEHPGHWEGDGDGPADPRFRGNDGKSGNDEEGRDGEKGVNNEEGRDGEKRVNDEEGRDGEERVNNEGDGEFVLPPGLPRPLGEVIVSWPQAQRQAGEHGLSPMQELAHLVVHGILHLVGYDHVEPEEAALMQAREREALNALALDRFLGERDQGMTESPLP